MTEEQVIALLILALAGFIRGAFGFGDALFAMPLLAIIMPVSRAAPLMALSAFLIAVVILIQEWKAVDFRATLVLIVAGIIGVPIGVVASKNLDAAIVKSALGGLVIVFAVWSLWRPDLFSLKTDRSAPIFGIAAGILGGAYNTSGPPLVVFANLRKWPVDKFRAMMQAYCLISSTSIIAAHWWVGNVTKFIFMTFAVSGPLMVLATIVGQRMTRNLATDRFVRLVHWLLFVVGVGLIWSSVVTSE